MASYKYYFDDSLDISDGPITLDLSADIDGTRHPIMISCDEGDIGVELKFDEDEDFGDQGTLNSCDDVLQVNNVIQIRLTALQDKSKYRIWAGLS